MDKKLLLGVAVAAAIGSGSAFAAPSVHVYGEIDASINHSDEDTAAGADQGTFLDMESFHSVIGITGGDKLGNGMRAFYRAEYGYQTTEGATDFDGAAGKGGGDTHERYVGLAGGFGKIRIGQIDTIYDDAVDATDIFQSVHAVNAYASTRRAVSDNTVRYDSNEIIKGLTASASVSANGAADGEGEADVYQFGANYDMGSMSAHYAYTNTRANGGPSAHTNALAISLDLGAVDLAANFERSSSGAATNANRVFVTAAFAANDNLTLAAGLGRGNSEETRDDEVDSLVLAAHYNMSQKTVGYVEFASNSNSADGETAVNKKWVNIGVRHSFGNPRR